MSRSKKAIIISAVLLIIAVGAFFYFYIPGAWIGGISEISLESSVIIRRDTATKNQSGTFEHSITEYTLNADQINMLKELILGSSFSRTLGRSVLSHNTTNLENYNSFDIVIRDDSFIAVHDTTMISVSWGYFSGFKQSGNGWIKINNSDFFV